METFLIPMLTGLFGWMLIWLLAKSLFFPTKAIQIGGFSWESNLARLINQFPVELLIPKEADSAASFKAMQPLMEEKLDFFFNHTIKDKLPMMSMFIGDKTVAQLKAVFLEELASIFPQMIGQLTQNATMNMSKSLAVKLSDTIAPIIMKAIKPMQWAAFILGICWGGIMVFLLHSF
ncbi:MAG: hypothetical protein EXR15_08320 [Chitinophagaceae bacterium]|nr:hypothetical protein [Chitinophagaceae bacterium]